MVFTTVPKEHQSLLVAIVGPLEAMPNLAARVALNQVPLAASALADRNGVIRRAEARASAAEAVPKAVVAFTVAAAAAERVHL